MQFISVFMLIERRFKALDVKYTLRDGFCFQLMFVFKKSNITDMTLQCWTL